MKWTGKLNKVLFNRASLPPEPLGLQSTVHNAKRFYAKTSLLFKATNFIRINPMEAITIFIGIPKKDSHNFL